MGRYSHWTYPVFLLHLVQQPGGLGRGERYSITGYLYTANYGISGTNGISACAIGSGGRVPNRRSRVTVRNNRSFFGIFPVVALLSILFSSCESGPAAAPIPPGAADKPELYLSLDGRPGIHYSRNVAAFFPEDYGLELDWSEYGGTRVIRFGLVDLVGMGGYPYTNTGELNEKVVRNFESLLDDAAAHGIYVIFWITGWGQWNTTGQSDWAKNPFNARNGGPAEKSTDVFQDGTRANTMWLEFIDRLVTRWQDRENILAWDVLGEANLIQGISERQGMAFVERMAQVIHAADTQQRLITASLGDVGTWGNFYDSPAIDFVQTHPYPENLDRAIIEKVHQYLARYHKPVQIGECGLNWEKPDMGVTSSPNARIGIQHAIWAGVVSGAMNARALFWEDGFAIHFATLRSMFLNRYAEAELPAVRFTQSVDFTGFEPLTARHPIMTKVWGAAVGNETYAIGWFRDAGSEPPNWKLLPKITGQTVSLEVPGSEQEWQVDFYDTKTGNLLSGSTLLDRRGNLVTVPLPDFTDDIAFKLFVNATGALIDSPAPEPEPAAIVLTSTSPAAGQWVGSVFGTDGKFAAVLTISIKPDCTVGSVCGKSAFNWCSIDLVLRKIDGDTLVFDERIASGTSTCAAGGIASFRLQQNGTVLFHYNPGSSGGPGYDGILRRK